MLACAAQIIIMNQFAFLSYVLLYLGLATDFAPHTFS